MDVLAYLRRIDYQGSREPTAETLHLLHRAHLLAIPFENLDLARHREIVIEEERFYEKIVVHGRGGFCYEVNGLFAWLLRQLGFPVVLLSARVADAEGRGNDEFDHLTLQVKASGTWLADVGFGDCFIDPLALVDGFEQFQNGATYRLTRSGERWLLERRSESDWNLLYDFSLTPRQLSDFTARCGYHQNSPHSHFLGRDICSRVTPGGRITLAGMKLIESDHGRRSERVLTSDQEYQTVLREQFGVVLDT